MPGLRSAVAFLGLWLAGSPASAAKTDVVVLQNGDHLTGEVDHLERGRLALKTDDMGTLQIEWDKVKSVTAAAQFDIANLEGHRYIGSLQSTSVAGELRIVTAGGPNVVRLIDIGDIQRVGSSFWKRLDGSLDVGASYTSATEVFKLDVAGEISSYRPGYEFSTNGNTTVTTQPETEDTSRSLLSFAYGRKFGTRWLALVKGQLEQNSELGFDLRSSVTAGGARDVIRRQGDRLRIGTGLSVNREQPVDGETTTNIEATAMVGYDRFAYDFPKVDMSIALAGFQSLNDSGRHRLEAEARFQRELVKDFYATLRGYESYDSRPPVAESPRNDYGVTFALGWSF